MAAGTSLRKKHISPYTGTYGWGAAVAENSKYIAVGAGDYGGTYDYGIVNVYRKSDDVLVASLTDHAPSSEACHFGMGIAMDEQFLYIGAPEEHMNIGGHAGYPDVGRVYVYSVNDIIAPELSFYAYLDTPEYDTFYSGGQIALAEAHDNFGHTLDIVHGDLLITAPYAESGATNAIGKLYLFEKNYSFGSYTWTYTYQELLNGGGSSLYSYGGTNALHLWTNYNKTHLITGTSSKSPLGGTYRVGSIIRHSPVTLDKLWTTMHPEWEAITATFEGGFGIFVQCNEYYAVGSSPETSVGGVDNRGRGYILDVETGELVHTIDPPAEDAAVIRFGCSAACSDGVAFFANPLNGNGVVYLYNCHDGAYLGRIDAPSGCTAFGGVYVSTPGSAAAYKGIRVENNKLFVPTTYTYAPDPFDPDFTVTRESLFEYSIPQGYGLPPTGFWDETRGVAQRAFTD